MAQPRAQARILARVSAQPSTFYLHAHARRARPLREWEISTFVFVHHLQVTPAAYHVNARIAVQAAAEFRQGLHKSFRFFVFAVILICMFLLGHDSYAIHGSQAVTRSQLLENKYDFGEIAVLADVRTHANVYQWLRNVWAPGTRALTPSCARQHVHMRARLWNLHVCMYARACTYIHNGLQQSSL